jgi:hypothetical protein
MSINTIGAGNLACWVGVTPDIHRGDVVRATGAGSAGEFTTVAGTAITQPSSNVGGTIVVKGVGADPTGVAPLPLASLLVRIVSTGGAFAATGKRDIRAPGQGTLTFDPVDPVTNPNGVNITASFAGLSAGDQALATASTALTRIAWLGPVGGGLNPAGFPAEMTVAENGFVPGPLGGCAAPLARYAVTSVDQAHTVGGSPTVNVANSTGDLVVSGASQDSSSVTATLTDGAKTITAAAVAPTPATGAQSWSATFPAAAVATLADGNLTAAGSYTVSTGCPAAPPCTITGATLKILKRTVAPPPPTAGPGAGTYPTAQSVTLNDSDPTAVVHYTLDGTTPTAGSATTNPVQVTGTATITAIAIDPAGNQSPLARFAYVIQPPAPQIIQAPAPAPAPLTPVATNSSRPAPLSKSSAKTRKATSKRKHAAKRKPRSHKRHPTRRKR